MSPIAVIANSVVNNTLRLMNVSRELISNIEKYAPRLKNRIVCGINALLYVAIHQTETMKIKNTLVYLMI